MHQELNIQAEQHGITLQREGLGQRFEELIQTLGAGPQKVVLLIDEYDKPLTDYLTLKDYDPEVELYTLGFPNREVKASMYQHLLATFRHGSRTDTQGFYAHLKRAMDAGDLPKAMDQIDKMFSTIPYEIFDQKREGFFHAVLHLTFQGLGLLTQSEVSTANGRVDCVVRSKSGIYVLEFKLDDSAAAALTQIRDKRYGSPCLGGELPVIAVGISFSSETKTVVDWEETPYEQLLAEG